MKAPSLPALCRIPDEPLYEVLDALDDESALQLILTCTDLHCRVLPIFFERRGIKSLNTGRISLHNDSKRALGALFFIQDFNEVAFSPDPDSDNIYSNIRAMTHFVARLPNITVFNLHFGGLESWFISLLLDDPHSCDARSWMKNLTRLLNDILETGCTALHIHGAGDSISGSLQDTIRRVTPAVQESIDSTVNPSQYELRDLQMFSISRNRGSGPSAQPQLPRHTAGGHHILKEFRIYSQVLLQRPFIPWIRYALHANAASITSLSFKSNRMEHATIWKGILSSTTLPSLYEFELGCHEDVNHWIEVDFAVLTIFLSRHPSIRYLHLTAIYTLIPLSYPRFPLRLFLPQLVKLEAHPFFISWLLNAEAPFLRFQHLSSVTVVSDYRPELHATDYGVFDGALSALANNNMTMDDIHLGLRFVAEFAVAQWMLRHILQSPGNTQCCIAALRCVTKLSICTTDEMNFHADREVLNAVPHFLAMLPYLEDVSFEQPGLVVLDPGVIQNITEVCPRLKRLTVYPR